MRARGRAGWRVGVSVGMVVLVLAAASVARGQSLLTERMEREVEGIRLNGSLRVDGATIRSSEVLPAMYEQHGFEPLWTDPAVREDLVRSIRTSQDEGLEPSDYHLESVAKRLAASDAADPESTVFLDLLLTDAFIQLAYDYRFGKVDPEQLDPHWNHPRQLRDGDPALLLLQAIEDRQVTKFLQGLLPQQPFYRQLRLGLASYNEIHAGGGWPRVPEGAALKPGMSDRRVPILRRRLAMTGDLPAEAVEAGADLYDGAVVEALKTFQARHGLEADGALGPATLVELNTPVEHRIAQIRVSLERSRWVMNDLPERFVLVNVAGFQVYVMEGGQAKWSSAVVVGTPYTKTPIFRADMKYVVLNPTWTIPASIVRKEVLPGLRRDPGYLSRKGYRREGGQFVQPPGDKNALGRIKLMLPNPYSVYLHDTPSKSFFSRTSRSFSHGCVRVQKPLELAAQVLADPAWTVEALQAAIDTGKTRTVMLKKPIPVLILYWTAAADESGRVTFRPDIYGRDPAVIRALQEPARVPARGVRRSASAGED